MKKDNMTLLEAALECPQCVVSVMGDHAGEGADAIFNRKKADIERMGVTFWLMRSPKARPPQVQRICRTFPAYTIFVEPATKGGARPTTEEDAAKEYSDDGVLWHQLPKGLSPVTGKLDTGATALVFDMMTTDVSGTLDLWDYGEASGHSQTPQIHTWLFYGLRRPKGHEITSRKNEVALSWNCRCSTTCGSILCLDSMNR